MNGNSRYDVGLGGSSASNAGFTGESGWCSAFFEGEDEGLKSIFKGLVKKDSMTKIKALQNLVLLLNGADDLHVPDKAELRYALKHFNYHYLRLSLREVNDNRIRELVNVLVLSFAKHVPKMVVKSCDAILGELLCSAADVSSREIRKSAFLSLEYISNLSGGKCRLLKTNEVKVTSFIRNRILSSTSSYKNIEIESAERLQASAIAAASFVGDWVGVDYFGTIVFELLKPSPEHVFKLLWGSKSFAVRREAHRLLISLYNLDTISFGSLELSITNDEFVSILWKFLGKEKNPLVLPSLLELIIVAADRLKIEGINFFSAGGDYRKTFFPKLWEIFRHGGYNAGRGFFDKLVPLLSRIPCDVWEAYSQEVLANKWLEELVSAAGDQEKVSFKNMPVFAETLVGCLVWFLENEIWFDEHYILVLLNLRFGDRQLIESDALSLLLKKTLDLSDTTPKYWCFIKSHLIEFFHKGNFVAERVSEALFACSGRRPCGQVARELFLESYHDVKASSVPTKAIDLLFGCAYFDAGDINEDAMKNLILDLKSMNGNQRHLHCLVFRYLSWTVAKSGQHQAEMIWTMLAESLFDTPAKICLIDDAIDALKAISGDIIFDFSFAAKWFLGHPTFLAIDYFHSKNWISQGQVDDLVCDLASHIESAIDNLFSVGSIKSDNEEAVVWLKECVKICEEFSERTACLGNCHLVSFMLSEFSSVSLEGKLDSSVVEYLKKRLTEALYTFTSVDWQGKIVVQVVAAAAAHFLILEDILLVEDPENISKSDLTVVEHRKILVTMWASERYSDEKLVLILKSPSLLWKLLCISANVSEDWRKVFLVPYILSSTELFCDVLQYAAERDSLEFHFVEPLVNQASKIALEVAIDKVLWPALTPVDEQVSFFTVQTASKSRVMDLLLKFDLLPKLTEVYWTKLLQCINSSKRAQLHDCAEELFAKHLSLQKLGSLTEREKDDISSEGSTSQDKESPASSALPESPSYDVGERIIYLKGGVHGIVTAIHHDDPDAKYYTITLSSDSSKSADIREVQTTAEHIQKKDFVPKTLEELNKLLAQARRNGDYKESIRLMKLLPSLTPKPVDSEEVRRRAIEDARERRKRALARLQLIQMADSGSEIFTAYPEHAASSDSPDDVEISTGSPLSENYKLLSHRLKCYVELIAGVLPARLEVENVKRLCFVCVSLSSIASLPKVASFLRVANSKDVLYDVTESVLIASCCIFKHFSSSFILAEDQTGFFEAIFLSCIRQKNYLELRNRAFESLSHFDQFSVPSSINTELLLLCLDRRKPYEITSFMMEILYQTPVLCVEDLERRRSSGNLSLPDFVDVRENEDPQMSLALISLFARCCKESKMLVSSWWSRRSLLLSSLDSACVSDGRSPAYQSLTWCLLMILIQRARNLNVMLRSEVSDQVQSLVPIVGRVLRNSLLNEDNVELSLAYMVALVTLRVFPGVGRRWLNDSKEVNRAEYALVCRRMSEFVTPKIVVEELSDIDQAHKLNVFDNIEDSGLASEKFSKSDENNIISGTVALTTSVSLRTVTAVYKRVECEVEIQVEIPRTYPLRDVNVKCTKGVGIKKERWRRMLLQITQMLSVQDGTLLDALVFWKHELDKEFQGIEPCPICYSVVHTMDRSLPKFRCPTCKNAFHTPCMMKWFKSSQQSACPLCKQPV